MGCELKTDKFSGRDVMLTNNLQADIEAKADVIQRKYSLILSFFFAFPVMYLL